jgi:hypothetical protein
MPVQQMVPQIQANTAWAQALQKIGDIASGAAQQFVESRKRAGHNEKVRQAVLSELEGIKNRNGISDKDFQKILSPLQVVAADDDPDFGTRVSAQYAPLLMWDYTGAAKKGVALPIPGATDPKIQMASIQSATDTAETNMAVEAALGTPPQPTPQGISEVPKSFQRPESLFSSVAAGGSPVAPPVQSAIDTLTAPMDTSKMPASFQKIATGPTPFSEATAGAGAPPAPTASTTAPQPVSNVPQNAPQQKDSYQTLIESLDPSLQPHAQQVYTEAMNLKQKGLGKEVIKKLAEITEISKDDAALKKALQERNLINKGEMEVQQQRDKAAMERTIEEGKTSREVAGIRGQNAGRGIYVNLSPEETQALNNAISEGRIDPYKVNSRTAKIYANQELLNPGTNYHQISAGLGAQSTASREGAKLTDRKLQGANSGMVLINKVIDPKTDKVSNMKEITPQFTSELALQCARVIAPNNPQVGIEMMREFKQKTAQEGMSRLAAFVGVSVGGTTQENLRNIKRFLQREGSQAEKMRNIYLTGKPSDVGFDIPELTGGVGSSGIINQGSTEKPASDPLGLFN